MKTRIIVALCASMVVAAELAQGADPPADKPMKTETSGIALGAGYGHQFSGVGGQAIFYVNPGLGYLRLAPYVGAGVLFPGVEYYETKAQPGFSGGLMAQFGGRNHWGVVDANYGLYGVGEVKYMEMTYTPSTGIDVDTKTLSKSVIYAFTLGGGYEYMADGGFFVRPLLGLSFVPSVPYYPGKVAVTGSVGLGYKFQ